jgi:hypothetical protein
MSLMIVVIIIITLTETKKPLLGQYRKGIYQLIDKNGRKAYLNEGDSELDKHIALMEYEQEKAHVHKQNRKEDWRKRKIF